MPAETLPSSVTEAPPAEAPRRVRPAYDGPVTWADVCADPLLQDLPFKIELDRFGRILMSPAATRHSIFQGRIARLLVTHLGSEAFPELATRTTEGVRVPDVGWMSEKALARLDPDAEVLAIAPEICVEVRSSSNPWGEMEEKTRLFFAAGAQEVWICDVDGTMRFFGHEGERERSHLAPDFPTQIDL